MVIGITGTHGAGKGAVVGLLKEYGFIHCSARDIFLEELQKAGIPASRPTISEMANTLRERHGVDYVVKTFFERFDPASNDIIIESIYTEGEATTIRNAGGYIIAVDAPPDVRYERIRHRMSETDLVSKEEFIARQDLESRSTDPTKQNSKAVMETADFTVTNDGTIEELKVQVQSIVERIRGEETSAS